MAAPDDTDAARERAERLAAALRENLRRRKAQARGRSVAGGAGDGPSPPPAPPPGRADVD